MRIARAPRRPQTGPSLATCRMHHRRLPVSAWCRCRSSPFIAIAFIRDGHRCDVCRAAHHRIGCPSSPPAGGAPSLPMVRAGRPACRVDPRAACLTRRRCPSASTFAPRRRPPKPCVRMHAGPAARCVDRSGHADIDTTAHAASRPAVGRSSVFETRLFEVIAGVVGEALRHSGVTRVLHHTDRAILGWTRASR